MVLRIIILDLHMTTAFFIGLIKVSNRLTSIETKFRSNKEQKRH